MDATQCSPALGAPWDLRLRLRGILADLRTREDLPWSLLNIVEKSRQFPRRERASIASDSAPRTAKCC